MVTLQLLNQHEQEKGESSNEEEEEEDEAQPRSPSGQSQAPLDGERQEPPAVLSERVVQEDAPPSPQGCPTPQDDAQRREGEPSETEASLEIKERSVPPELACLPSRRALGPPTSVPPRPPGPVAVDSEGEEALGDARVREEESSMRLSPTSDPEKVDPPAVGPERPGGEPQPPELQEDRDATSSAAPSQEPCSPEAAPAASGAAPASGHCSQPPRCVPEQLQEQAAACGGCLQFFQGE